MLNPLIEVENQKRCIKDQSEYPCIRSSPIHNNKNFLKDY